MSGKTPLCRVCKEETGVVGVDVCQECSERTRIKPTATPPTPEPVEWVELIRKTTTEEGLLFATQKNPSERKTTTRVWEVNKAVLGNMSADDIAKLIKQLPEN